MEDFTKQTLLLQLIGYLKGQDILTCERVCKSWRKEIASGKFWKAFCLKEGISTDGNTCMKDAYFKEYRHFRSASSVLQHSQRFPIIQKILSGISVKLEELNELATQIEERNRRLSGKNFYIASLALYNREKNTFDITIVNKSRKTLHYSFSTIHSNDAFQTSIYKYIGTCTLEKNLSVTHNHHFHALTSDSAMFFEVSVACGNLDPVTIIVIGYARFPQTFLERIRDHKRLAKNHSFKPDINNTLLDVRVFQRERNVSPGSMVGKYLDQTVLVRILHPSVSRTIIPYCGKEDYASLYGSNLAIRAEYRGFSCYFVEYLPGKNLFRTINELSWTNRVATARKLLQILNTSYPVHASNFLYPQNVLLNNEGESYSVKLSPRLQFEEHRNTERNACFSCPSEYKEGGDKRALWYCVGSIFYFLFTSKIPYLSERSTFTRDEILQMVDAGIRPKFPPISLKLRFIIEALWSFGGTKPKIDALLDMLSSVEDFSLIQE